MVTLSGTRGAAMPTDDTEFLAYAQSLDDAIVADLIGPAERLTPLFGSHFGPVQPELPVWITTVGTKETWTRVGELGYNILTALVATTVEDTAEHIRDYRAARASSGHDPATGQVTAMIHTFLGEDVEEVRHIVQEPMISYIQTHLNQNAPRHDPPGVSPEALRETKARLAEFAFERYFRSTGLFGTVDTALATVARLTKTGIDEIACLIDFGVDDEIVLQGLSHIDALRRAVQDQATAGLATASTAR
jgi:natural product biosynthesis luciferase-like monooxygenase protein